MIGNYQFPHNLPAARLLLGSLKTNQGECLGLYEEGYI